MKQSQNNTCLACVLAIIVGEAEQYVLDWFKYQDPPLNDQDALIFLAHHGIFFAIQIVPHKKEIDSHSTYEVELSLKERAAYVIVESETYKGKHHAIYWDGYRVRDPQRPSQKLLRRYKVICFYPLMTTEERRNLAKALFGESQERP